MPRTRRQLLIGLTLSLTALYGCAGSSTGPKLADVVVETPNGIYSVPFGMTGPEYVQFNIRNVAAPPITIRRCATSPTDRFATGADLRMLEVLADGKLEYAPGPDLFCGAGPYPVTETTLRIGESAPILAFSASRPVTVRLLVRYARAGSATPNDSTLSPPVSFVAP